MALPALLMGLIPDLVKKAVSIFDKKFQTESEKEEAIRDFTAETETRLQKAWQQEQEQLSLRHKQDMTSDSFLSKNIRPLVLIYLMTMLTVAFFQGMTLNTEVLDWIGNLSLVAFSFYFGLRGVEKVFSINRKNK